MTRLASVTVLAVAVGTTGLFAQARPNFSGKWTIVPTPAPAVQVAGLSARSSWSGEVTLTQDTMTLTIEYVSFSRSHAPVRLVYNLDGSERQNIDRNSVAPQERLSRAAWRGSQLVLTTVWPSVDPKTGAHTPLETTEVLSLDSPTTLSVQITRRFKGQTTTGTAIYRRE